MPTIPTPENSPSPGSRVLGLIARCGSPEERRMAVLHGNELAAFLDHPDTIRFSRKGSLDVGLENRPVLKFNLIAGVRVSPWGLINEWAERIPRLQEVAELVLRHKLRCHAGIKLSATGVEYELYPYETPERLLASQQFSAYAPEQTGLPAAPYCFGYTSNGDLSAYADIQGVDAAELEEALGVALPASGLKVNALFHSRWNANGSWRTDKAGIEFMPFPSHMLNAVLAQLNLHFAYLLYRGGTRRYGVIGMHGGRQLLYTTLLPIQALKRPPHE